MLNSRLLTDSKDSDKWMQHRDRLLQEITQLVVKSQDQDSQFYEGFKNEGAHTKISDLQTQLEISSKLDDNKKNQSIAIFKQISQILKNYSTRTYKIQNKITQSLYNLQRDTIRIIYEIYDTYSQIEPNKWLCKGNTQKQYDKHIRQLEIYCYFWEQLHQLENSNTVISSNEFNQCLNGWYDQLMNDVQLKLIESIKKSKQNYQDTQLRQAHELYVGLGTEKNIINALTIYQKLADENNSIAQAIMGQLLMEGELIQIDQDFDKAFEYFKQSADQGNTFSVYWLSKLILEQKVFNKFYGNEEENQNNKKDYELAIKLLKKGAELGHIPSMNYLGDLYTNGLELNNFILEKDHQDAEFYYKQAQKRNSIEAVYKLSMLYQEMSKQSLNKNRKQLIYQLLNQAKNEDYLPAFYDLGILLLNGLGEEIQPNPCMAEMLFENGASKGDIKCATKLLNMKFKNINQDENAVVEFLELLDKLEKIYREHSIINYFRGKIYCKSIQWKKAIEQFRIGSWKGCLKCKTQLENILKDKDLEINMSSQLSFQQQRLSSQIPGLIEQVKQTDWKKNYQKQKISQHRSVEQENQSTKQDRHTIMTISIVKQNEQNEQDRKRGQSEYTNLKKIENINSINNIQLSQLKLSIYQQQQQLQQQTSSQQQQSQQQQSTSQQQQQQQSYGSPRQPSLVNISSNSSRKERFNFQKLPSHRSSNSSKYLFNQL